MTQGKLYQWLAEIAQYKQFDDKRLVESVLAEVKDFLDEVKAEAPTDILKKLDPTEWINWFEKYFGNNKP